VIIGWFDRFEMCGCVCSPPKVVLVAVPGEEVRTFQACSEPNSAAKRRVSSPASPPSDLASRAKYSR